MMDFLLCSPNLLTFMCITMLYHKLHVYAVDPVEDGTPYTLTCSTNTSRLMLYWMSQGHELTYEVKASCNLEQLKCSPNTSSTHAVVTRNGTTVTSSLHINMTTNLTNIFCDVGSDGFYYFPIVAFCRAQQVTCSIPSLMTSSTHLSVECQTEKIYPKLFCQFYSGNEALARENITYTNTQYTTSVKTPYYKSTCMMSIPLARLKAGLQTFFATLSPNVTMGTQYGVNSSIVTVNLSLPTSALQTDCPGESDYLRVGQTYVCTCRRTSLGNPPGQVQWVTSDGQVRGVSAEDGSWSKLNITYSLTNAVYICSGVSALGRENSLNILRPKFQGKSEVLSFTVNGQSGRVSTHLGDVTELTCTASGSPPPQVSITRTRGVSVVTTADSATSIHHVIPSFTCDDVDEYICQVQNGDGVRQASSVVVGSSCPCKLQPNQPSSVNLTVSVGGNALLTVHLFCSPKPDVFTLTFTLGGSQFEINRQRYSVMYQEETPFYGGANLAMYDMQDGDFRQYTLTVGNGMENSLKIFFSLTKESNMEEDKGRVVGLAIGLTLTALAIIILSLFVFWFYKRRRRNNSGNPGPSSTQINHYSSPNTADGVSNGGYHVYEDVDANNGYVSIDNSSGESLYIRPRLSNV